MSQSTSRPDLPQTNATRIGHAEASALAAIVLSSRDAVIAETVDGIVTAWNDGATAVYGHTAQQMLGQSIELTIPPDALQVERARHARVAEGGHESGYRCVRVRVDGRSIDVVMSMSPVRDGTGRVVGVASISRRASDKENADARVASVLEAAPDAMVSVDSSGRIVLVNSRVSALFGYGREELIGAMLELLVPIGLREQHRQHREGLFRHPQPREMGARQSLLARRRDGSTFPAEVSLAWDTYHGETLAIAAVRDVTEQRATEASLRESESRLRQLAEHVDTVFTLRQIDPPAYLYVSPGFHKLTGRDPAELMSHPDRFQEWLHAEDRERVSTEYLKAIRSGLPASAEYRIVRVDGEVRWVRAFVTPVPNPLGQPERIVTATEDITDRVQAAASLREAEAAARTASEAKNEFLSRMSHELRTPLNAVLGFGQLLEIQLKDTDQADSVRHIIRAGRHLLDLLNEVLDIARIEARELPVSPEPVSIAAVVDETSLLMVPLAAAANVALVVSGGPAGRYVLADRQRLRQILLNLISNAVKYNHDGGGVWLSWRDEEAHRASVTIRDDGRGIATDMHDRLFTPFDRLGAESSGVEGTGVGLTVTRGLAELMNGSVTFQSEVGRGSSFTVTLPMSEKPFAKASEIGHQLGHSTSSAEALPGRLTLLYIEDNEPNVRVMEAVLDLRPEWHLIHAGLATLGMEYARAHRPDLVLLDVHLPDGTGLDVLSALKNDRITADLPVVVLSADASQKQVKRLLEAGAERYLTKPLEVTEVLALLDATARPASRHVT